MYAPYFESFITKIFEYAGVDDYEFNQFYGAVFTSCQYELPSIWVQVDGKWLEARSSDYLVPGPIFDSCMVSILPSDMPLQVVGMPWFVDYYSVHDPVESKISWAPHTKSSKSDLIETEPPT